MINKNTKAGREQFLVDLVLLLKKHNVTLGGFDDGLTIYFNKGKKHSIKPEPHEWQLGPKIKTKHLFKMILDATNENH